MQQCSHELLHECWCAGGQGRQLGQGVAPAGQPPAPLIPQEGVVPSVYLVGQAASRPEVGAGVGDGAEGTWSGQADLGEQE